jgi:hypothetical protein
LFNRLLRLFDWQSYETTAFSSSAFRSAIQTCFGSWASLFGKHGQLIHRVRLVMMESRMLEWLEEHKDLLWPVTVLSILMFVGALISVPLLVARIPADYFIRRPVRDWPTRHPAVHLVLVAAKNLIGLVLLLAGLAMLVLPGQGLLTVVVAIMLLDFPGKRRFELWLIRRRPIFRAVSWIRAKCHRSPLELPNSKVKSGDIAGFE